MLEQLELEGELILASASEGRAQILSDAGLVFRQEASGVDERDLEAEAAGPRGAPEAGALAFLLAAAKAKAMSAKYPRALIIGADQVMECNGTIYRKPHSMQAARNQLLLLRGKTHMLHSAVCLAWAGEVVWEYLDRANLTMRDFSDEFLDRYCEMEGEELLQSVGAYRIEGVGIQLFSEIDGNHHTIIGLPLLPLLSYLRDMGWLVS